MLFVTLFVIVLLHTLPNYEGRVLTLPPKSPIGNVGLGPALQDSLTQKNGLLFCYLFSFFCFANSHLYHGATIIGGAPTVLDRRRATPLIGDAVCNCLIGSAESSSTPNYSQLLTKQKRSLHTCVRTLFICTRTPTSAAVTFDTASTATGLYVLSAKT